jgi:hypothetical protein
MVGIGVWGGVVRASSVVVAALIWAGLGVAGAVVVVAHGYSIIYYP